MILLLYFLSLVTVRCCYNPVDFLQNLHNIHPIACLFVRGMGCILWVQTVIYTLPQSLQWCMQYHVILDHVIMALDSIWEYMGFSSEYIWFCWKLVTKIRLTQNVYRLRELVVIHKYTCLHWYIYWNVIWIFVLQVRFQQTISSYVRFQYLEQQLSYHCDVICVICFIVLGIWSKRGNIEIINVQK